MKIKEKNNIHKNILIVPPPGVIASSVSLFCVLFSLLFFFMKTALTSFRKDGMRIV